MRNDGFKLRRFYDGKIIFTPLMPNDNIFILLYDELG